MNLNCLLGSNLYVIPINDTGRKPKNYPLLHAHSELITDLDFSPFDDGLLATGSQDSLVTTLLFFSPALLSDIYTLSLPELI